MIPRFSAIISGGTRGVRGSVGRVGSTERVPSPLLQPPEWHPGTPPAPSLHGQAPAPCLCPFAAPLSGPVPSRREPRCHRAPAGWERLGQPEEGRLCVSNSWQVCFGTGAVSALHNRPGPAGRLGHSEVAFGSCVLMRPWASARQMCCPRVPELRSLDPLGLAGMALYL